MTGYPVMVVVVMMDEMQAAPVQAVVTRMIG